jgi:hypothetical protein
MHALKFKQEHVVSLELLVTNFKSVNCFTTLRIKVAQSAKHLQGITQPLDTTTQKTPCLNNQVVETSITVFVLL